LFIDILHICYFTNHFCVYYYCRLWYSS